MKKNTVYFILFLPQLRSASGKILLPCFFLLFSPVLLLLGSQKIEQINPELLHPHPVALLKKAASLSLPYQEREAAKLLFTVHLPESIAALREGLLKGSAAVRQVSARLLAGSDSQEDEINLIRAMTDKNIFVRDSAVYALRLYYQRKGAGYALERLGHDFKQVKLNSRLMMLVRIAALRAISQSKDKLGRDEILNIEPFWKASAKEERGAACAVFQTCRQKDYQWAVKKLTEILLRELEAEVRAEICLALSVCGKGAIKPLEKALLDQDEGVRLEAAGGLVLLGEKKYLAQVHEALGSEQFKHKLRAVVIITKLASPFSEPELVKLLSEPDSGLRLRLAAIFALGSLSGKVITPGLTELAGSNDPRIRSAAVFALHRQGALGMHWRLLNDLENKNAFIRAAAARTLGELGAKQAVDKLIESLVDPDLDVAVNSAVALGKIEKNRAAELALVRVLTDKRFSVAFFAAQALVRHTGLPFIKAPVKALNKFIGSK